MAKQTLDTNESGSYTGDGGTSNNAKANANFTELYAADVALDTRVDTLEAARSVYGLSAESTLGNPLVSTAFAGKATLPANRVTDGDILRISYLHRVEGGSPTSPQWNFSLRLGGIEIVPEGGAFVGMDDPGNIAGSFDVVVATAGASSVLHVPPHAAKRDGSSPANVDKDGAVDLPGPDFTAACDLVMKGLFSATNAGNVADLYDLRIEVIRPV